MLNQTVHTVTTGIQIVNKHLDGTAGNSSGKYSSYNIYCTYKYGKICYKNKIFKNFKFVSLS